MSAEPEQKLQRKKFETVGNETTMNLNTLLYQNIIASPYFNQLYEMTTYHEVVDEIYNHVQSLEPFLMGTSPSTAFCLLYKLWTIRLTYNQINGLVRHVDSPYIRALGFLYLRYVCKPADLWQWFEPYLDDEEEVQVQSKPFPKTLTIGRMLRDLLTEQKWQGTLLPRIPVPVAKDLMEKLKQNPPKLPGSVDKGFEDEEADYRSVLDYDNKSSKYDKRDKRYVNDDHRHESRDYGRRRDERGGRSRSPRRDRDYDRRSGYKRDYNDHRRQRSHSRERYRRDERRDGYGRGESNKDYYNDY